AAASINRPLTTGDKLWADQNSRAEVELGSAVVRLGSATGFSFLNLNDQSVQINVSAGTAIVHVRDLPEQQNFEIDTPNIAVTLLRPGDYRVEVSDSGDSSVVKVSDGEAEVALSGATIPIRTQQAVTFTGTDEVNSQQSYLGAPDALDEWSLTRDRRYQQAAAQNDYVSPDVAGAADLNEYGNWESTPDYGPVWTPTAVDPGWAPYQYGRWVWVSPWGWTWVDEAPWGFAPFHYGRWAYYHERWCWVPGPRRVRPVYAPALVAWVGRPGPATALVVGGAAAVAWFALGPREVYVPSYRVSNDYVRNVNVTNTTIVNNTYITNVYENKVTNINYVNRDKPGAVAAVPQNVFTSAQPVHTRMEHVPPAQLARFRAEPAAPAIAPARESVLAPRPNMSARRPPPAVINRPAVARVAPPPPPVPFDRQQAAIRANGGRPLAQNQLANLRPQQAAQQVRVVTPGPVRNAVQPGAGARPQPAPGRAEPAPRPEQSIADRERALHGSALTAPQQRPGAQSEPRTNIAPAGSPRSDRPPGATGQPPASGAPASVEQRPPAVPTRRNDMYRPPQNGNERVMPQAQPIAPPRPMQDTRPVPAERPQARPVPEARPLPQTRPYEATPRAVEQPIPREPQRPAEAPRAVEQPRALAEPRAAPAPPPARAPELSRPLEPARIEARPPEPRAEARAPEQHPAEPRQPPPHPGPAKPGEPRQ
ncbi:MAG: FecR domain-containing protein, partial [Sinobacteraceae bacterium]|nr:FecR domain-containing protein [Nevskiaceae bacterium]